MPQHLENRQPRIALLGTYLALYDTAFTGYRERMLQFAHSIAESFADEVEIVLLDAATQDTEMAALLEESVKHDADGVILLSLGYTASTAVSQSLADTPLPLLIFNTQEITRVDRSFCYEDMVWNHGMQGVQDIAAALTRAGKHFDVVTGMVSQQDTREELLDHLRVWCATREVAGSMIGSFGPSMPNMGDAQVEPSLLSRFFGINTIPLSYETLGQLAREATQDDVHTALMFDKEHFDIASDMTPEDHERSLRLELGLRKLVSKHTLAGMQLSFEQAADSQYIDTIPFSGITKLMGEGLAYAGEGDLLATAGGVIAHRLCGDTTFTEMYTMDFSDNTILHTHMAECNWRMARYDCKPRLLRREFTLAECLPFAAFVFSLEPGDVTLFDLTLTASNEFRFIVMEAEVIDFPALDGMSIPNFKVRFPNDIRPILSEYSRLGGTHHLNLVYGKHARRFRLLAKHMGIHFNLID